MLGKNAPDMFSYSTSRFVVRKSKEGTGRVVMWREAGIQNSYTLEATFAGSMQRKLKGIQFSTAHLENMGYHLCDTLLDYCDPDQSKTEMIMRELEDDYRRSVITALAALGQELPPGVDPLDIEIDPALAEADSSDAGSDSSESDGPPVHLQWKHRKNKKKKKLKSRKERNKRKALLKMNHQRAYSIPQPSRPHPVPADDLQCPKKTKTTEVKEEKRKEHTTQQPCDILSSHPSTHNSGIPTFVQDRLEERQRRRDDDDSSEALVGIPSEQLRQALLHIQATHTQQAPSSTVFLPHPSCPMNISQVNMYDVSRRQSRLNSKISLPHIDSGSLAPTELPPLPISTSKGAFTSQYVAHHLQHIDTHPSSAHAADSGINNTKNLSNLSRLFRQLRPQNLHSSRVADDQRHPKPTTQTTFHEKDGSIIPEQRQGILQREAIHDIIRQHYNSGTTTGNHTLTTTTTHHVEENIVEDDTKKKKYPQFYSEPQKTVLYTRNAKTTSETSTDDSTQSSSGILSHSSQCNSPVTSSWESFCKGVNLADKKGERGERVESRECKQQEKQKKKGVESRKLKKRMMVSESIEAKTVMIDAQLAAQGDEKCHELIDHLAMKQRSKQYSSNQHTEPAVFRSVSPQRVIDLPPDKMRTAAIQNHKQGIADAVKNTLSRTVTPHQSSCDSHILPISKSKSDPLPSSKFSTRNDHNNMPVHGSQPLRQHQHQYAASRSEFTQPATSHEQIRVGPVMKSEYVKHNIYRQRDQSTGEVHVEHIDNTRAYYDETSTRTSRLETIQHSELIHPSTNGESLLRRMYTSKPPSRYGPRPGPCDGVPPATLSLKLSGTLKRSRPATVHNSSRRSGKHGHIRYFTRKT